MRILAAILLLIVLALPSCRSNREEEIKTEEEHIPLLPPDRPVEKDIVFEEPNLPQPLGTDIAPGKKTVECETEAVQVVPKAKIAIIIDDMGYHQHIGDQLLELDLNLTFSFLPKAPFTVEQEERAWEEGRDILLHMPMEAQDPAWDPGPGSLYLKFSPEKIRAMVIENLNEVPHAIGSNNHMGSKFTENAEAMSQVLSVLKQRQLFFVDSYTTSRSTGLAEAVKMSIPAARRHVFLDNAQNQDEICDQLKKLVALAKKQGWAIGIGHPNSATLKALTRCREYLQANAEIVGVHELVEHHLN